jgi:nitrate reductase gamma subunit
MSGSIVIVVSYVLLAIFAVAFITRTLRIWKMPVHLRWELAPVPHEKGKGHYGGSYLEEPEWWNKPREKDAIAELTYMAKEIVFLKALWEHNRKMWWFSYPFHLGMYLLSAVLGLVVLGGVVRVAGISGPGIGLVSTLVPILAGVGYALGAVGALGLFVSRILDPKLRVINTPLSFLNLLLLLGVFISGGWAILTLESFPAAVLGFLAAFLTANLSVAIPGVLALHVILAGVFLAYLPFTQMMHFVAKYFTYHEVRWNDEPLEVGGKMEREIQELLKQPVTWAAPHLRADGKKNWVDIATDTGAKEESQ